MAIEVTGLTKRYRDKVAVDDISFSVADGGVFAFVGSERRRQVDDDRVPHDRAALRRRGPCVVRGHDVRRDGERVRESIGVVFQESLLDPLLTVRENLRLRGAAVPCRAHVARRADHRAGRSDRARRLPRPAVRQALRRAAAARRHRPRAASRAGVLFLDEPTAGLDPASRALVWRTLHELSARSDLTVFLTTHYLEETEEAARVCIIDDGRIIADDTPAAPARPAQPQHPHRHDRRSRRPDRAGTRASGADPARDGDVVVIGVAERRRRPAPAGSAHGDRVRDFEFRHGRMDDVFLALTGHVRREVGAA